MFVTIMQIVWLARQNNGVVSIILTPKWILFSPDTASVVLVRSFISGVLQEFRVIATNDD